MFCISSQQSLHNTHYYLKLPNVYIYTCSPMRGQIKSAGTYNISRRPGEYIYFPGSGQRNIYIREKAFHEMKKDVGMTTAQKSKETRRMESLFCISSQQSLHIRRVASDYSVVMYVHTTPYKLDLGLKRELSCRAFQWCT